jgi:hypothetical protein
MLEGGLEGDRGGDGGVLVRSCWVECRAKFSVRGYFPPLACLQLCPIFRSPAPPLRVCLPQRKTGRTLQTASRRTSKRQVEFFAKYLF